MGPGSFECWCTSILDSKFLACSACSGVFSARVDLCKEGAAATFRVVCGLVETGTRLGRKEEQLENFQPSGPSWSLAGQAMAVPRLPGAALKSVVTLFSSGGPYHIASFRERNIQRVADPNETVQRSVEHAPNASQSVRKPRSLKFQVLGCTSTQNSRSQFVVIAPGLPTVSIYR